MAPQHPFTRFVAIGDSFTEGLGDPDPSSPGGFRGWADRVAEVLADQTPGLAYANLAVRGRLLDQVVRLQLDPALALHPDLITLSAGGNDVIRPGSDPDALAVRLDGAVGRLRTGGATVAVFTGPDPARTPVLGSVRGKAAVYNEHIRAIAAHRGARVIDLWAVRELRDARMWAPDRLHLSPIGHQTVAITVLETLGVEHDLQRWDAQPAPIRSWRRARAEDLDWAQRYFLPWVGRRLRGVSSGDRITAKRPEAGPVRRP